MVLCLPTKPPVYDDDRNTASMTYYETGIYYISNLHHNRIMNFASYEYINATKINATGKFVVTWYEIAIEFVIVLFYAFSNHYNNIDIALNIIEMV